MLLLVMAYRLLREFRQAFTRLDTPPCSIRHHPGSAIALIPRRENSKQRGRFFPKRLYKLRARIEQAIGKLKRFKRVAMRCEKTDASYSAIISFACGLMLVKSVHTA